MIDKSLELKVKKIVSGIRVAEGDCLLIAPEPTDEDLRIVAGYLGLPTSENREFGKLTNEERTELRGYFDVFKAGYTSGFTDRGKVMQNLTNLKESLPYKTRKIVRS